MYYTRGKTTPPIYLQGRRNRGTGGHSPHFCRSVNPIPIRGGQVITPLPQIFRPSYGPDLARERTESAHTFMGQSTYSLPFDEKRVVGGNKVTNALLSCPVAVKGSDRSRHISRLMPCTISLLFRSS